MVSIFKQKRIKGWWPFVARNEEDEFELTVGRRKKQMGSLLQRLRSVSVALVLLGKSRGRAAPFDRRGSREKPSW